MPTTGPADEPAAIRRVDWRFLLPESAFETVAVSGPADEVVLSGLKLVAGQLIRMDAKERPAATNSTPDLVVTIAPSRSGLEIALGHVPSGGWIYVGAGTRAITDRSSIGHVVRRLHASGFTDVRRSWHWPSEPAAIEIVPLDDTRAVLQALARRRSGRAARLKAMTARLALTCGVLDRLIPGWSVVARRSDEPSYRRSPSVIMDPIRASLPKQIDTRGSVVLLTPRFRASRHVIGLILHPARDGLAAVAKLPRHPDDDEGIRREAAALRRAAELGVSGVPMVLALHGAPRPVLFESALEGALIASREIRDRPLAMLQEIETWTRTLAGSRELRRVPLRSLWSPPIDRIIADVGSGSAVARLAQGTGRILDAYGDVSVPVVIEHGDLAPPNLLRLAGGGLGVVDWEVADLDGLPLGDLLFFASFATGTMNARRDHHPTLGPAALLVAERQATHLGIDPGLTPILALCMWVRWADRQLARFIDRTSSAEDRLPARHLDSWRVTMAHLDCRG